MLEHGKPTAVSSISLGIKQIIYNIHWVLNSNNISSCKDFFHFNSTYVLWKMHSGLQPISIGHSLCELTVVGMCETKTKMQLALSAAYVAVYAN